MSGRDLSSIAGATWQTKPAEHITALEEHLGRMKKLEDLITKVRRLGFGRSYDVGSALYYRLEAELWLEKQRSAK